MKLKKLIVSTIVFVTVMCLAIIPAFAASASTNITLNAGPVSISSVSIPNFAATTLTGADQTSQTTVGTYTVTDARGNGKGWNVQVSATQFQNGSNLLHDGAMVLSDTTGSAKGHSDSFDQSYIASSLTVTTTPTNYIVVPVSKGKGAYDFSGGKLTLSIWPSEAITGTYSSTVTVDVAPNV